MEIYSKLRPGEPATLDGANVEICDAVGEDNCVIFGLKEHEVMEYYKNGLYSAWTEYNTNPAIHNVVDELLTGPFVGNGDFHDCHIKHAS